MTAHLTVRPMEKEDYDGVYALWNRISGFAIRSIDDSRENIERFIRRNPGMSHVAVLDGQIVGAILCGHDGRRGSLYHVCVDAAYRQRGIGTRLAKATTEALKAEHINQVQLVAFTDNETGNLFWKKLGWKMRQDVNSYEMKLNDNNRITKIR